MEDKGLFIVGINKLIILSPYFHFKILIFLGLGLGDEKDVTVRGFETISSCTTIYLECYTSILGIGLERLVRFISE